MPTIPNFLNRYFNKEQPKPPPPISTGSAAALLVSFLSPFHVLIIQALVSATLTAAWYAGYLYTLLRGAVLSVLNHAPVADPLAGCAIRHTGRVTSVSLTCVVCSLITFVILTSWGGGTNGEALHSMGYWPVGLVEAGRALLLTAILFSGPLYETLLVDGGWRQWSSLRPVSDLFGEWIRWRNIIAGPFTEEVLFRSASVPLMIVAQTSVTRTIFLSPVIFGLAHFHHFYEFRVTHPHEPVAAALLRSLFQLTYTSLFGAYATFLFLRTGSLLAIFVVHAFCNVMGLPRLWGQVEPPSDMDDVAGDEDRGDGRTRPNGPRSSILWSIVYYVLLIGGAVGWWKNLGALTASDNTLVTMKI